MRYGDLGMWLIRRGWFTQDTGAVRGPLRQPLRTLLSRPIDARLSESARRALADHLRPDVTKLTTLVGFEPRNWSL